MAFTPDTFSDLLERYGEEGGIVAAARMLDEDQKTWPDLEPMSPEELAERGFTLDCGGTEPLSADEVAALGLPLPVRADDAPN
ncbi:hypothetical protein [Streptomyces sp. NPDC047024]|uniref:hypothetical protein n=1 Tax=Streptomyces sp. NPDC047024 TaxID=3155476 RepID=UPI0033DEDAC0